MLEPAEAWSRIDRRLAPLEPAAVRRAEALGGVLVHDVEARLDQPFADVSALDGYALAGPVLDDPTTPGASLPVVGESSAGHPPDVVLEPGQAARIMTGAIVPRGADRVVAVERTDGGIERMTLLDDSVVPDAGAAIRRRGEVIRAGDRLLERGTLLGPAAVALLASHGVEEVTVHRRPTVAFMSTGDEVVPAGTPLASGQLYDSNSPFLAAALAATGLETRALGIASDDRDDLRRRIERGLESDVLILCGGVSMGAYDFVEEILDELGFERLVESVAIQPGKPLVVARRSSAGSGDGSSGQWVLGLPGNPASVMTTFWLFARPLLHRLQGRRDGFWHGAVPAVAGAELPPTKDRDRFLVATVRSSDGRLEATPARSVGSHDLASAARGTALLRRPKGRPGEPAGTPCEILPLVDWPLDA